MTQQKVIPGDIHISPAAIAAIASRAALQSYGVVGMAMPNLASEVAAVLSRDPNRGVVVQVKGDEIIIDLYVIIEYGTRIATVANSLINAVRYQVEKSVGAPVAQVNIHVQGLRVTHPDS
ncbi:MAG: Asp23/Gls24 family envelope stress response protein [Anaerolineae bacterium]